MTGSGSPIRGTRWEGPDRQGADPKRDASPLGTLVVEAVGDIDLHRSAQFQHDLLESVEKKPQRIIVDLAGVPYMDSSGVASLVKLLARVRRDKIALKLAGLTPRVRSVFEITRLDGVFEIYPTVEEALAS